MVTGDGRHGLNGYRTHPLYTFAEAAHLAHVSAGTVRNWLLGYTARHGDVPPLFDSRAAKGAMVSFLQLVEIVVAAKFRKSEHVSFQTVRRAYENARSQWDLEYPFAHLRLEALGGHIVRRIHEDRPGKSVQALDTPEQWIIPELVLDTVHQFDYDLELAARWYPVGKDVPIIIDPRLSAGLPTIVGRGVTVQVIHKRFKARQSIAFIARDFDIKRNIIEEAVRYAELVVA